MDSQHNHKLHPFTCYFCNKLINNDTEFGHISNCGSVLEPCVNKCGSYVPRNMKSRHLKECKNKMSKSMTRLSFDGDQYQNSKDTYAMHDAALSYKSSHGNSLQKQELSNALSKFHDTEQLCKHLNQTVSVIQTKQQDLLASQNNIKMNFKMQCDKLQYQNQIFLEWKKSLETQLDSFKHEMKLFKKFQDETETITKLKNLQQFVHNFEVGLGILQTNFQKDQSNNLESLRLLDKDLNEFKDYYAQENAVIGALWNDYKTDVDQIKYDLGAINKTLDEHKTKNSSIIFDLRTASQISAETSDKLEIQERAVHLLKNEVAQLKLDVETLEEKSFGTVNTNDFTGLMLWKISNFSQKMEKAKENDTILRSFAFYTHAFGYKVRVQIFLNGIKKWKGRHMIACLHVLKGDYDLLLKWPCYIEGTLTLKDLYNHANPTNFSKYICAKRYSGDEENEEPQESSTQYIFVPHSTLLKQNFIKDDTLFIEIKIKSTNKMRDETEL